MLPVECGGWHNCIVVDPGDDLSPIVPSHMCKIVRVWISSSDVAAITAKGFFFPDYSRSIQLILLVRYIEQLHFTLEMSSPLGGIRLRHGQVAGRRPHTHTLAPCRHTLLTHGEPKHCRKGARAWRMAAPVGGAVRPGEPQPNHVATHRGIC